MAATVSELREDLLFHARLLYPSDSSSQKQWLTTLYLDLAASGNAEAVSVSGDGGSSTFQWRGTSPEDRRLALKDAIEHLEAVIAGATAASYSRPFGFKFVGTPHETFEGTNSTANVL